MDPAPSPSGNRLTRPIPWGMAASGTLLIALGLALTQTGGPRQPALAAALFGCAQAALGAAGLLRESAARRAEGLCCRMSGWLGIPPVRLLLLLNGLALGVAARAASGDGLRSASWLATPAWLAAIALVCIGAWDRARAEPVDRWTRTEIAALALLTVAALAMRTWRIASMPYVLSGDEGSAGLTAWEFRTGARDNLLGLGWFSFPSLYFGLLSIPQIVLGRTAEAIRIASAWAGALTVPALYWAARRMIGRPAAFAAAAWLMAFHVHVFFSRLAYNNIFDGLFLVLAAGGIWRGWQDGDRRPFILAGLALGFSQYFYTTAHLTPAVLAVWVVLLALDRKPDRARLSGIVVTGIVATAVFLPLGLLYVDHPDMLLFTAGRVSMLVPGWTEEAAAALGTTSAGLVLEQIWVTGLGLTVAELQGVYAGPGVPMLISVSAVLFLAGLGLCLARVRNPRCSLPLLILTGTILLGGLSIQAPSSQRLLYLSPALALIVVLPLEEARAWAARRWPGGQRAVTALAGVLLVIMVAQNTDHLFRRYFSREEYGSPNGAVSQAMIEMWPALPPGIPVYFFGGDRMGFASIPSITYLQPEARAIDAAAATEIPSETETLIAIVLPNEAGRLADLQTRFPGGTVAGRYNRFGRLLFDLYLTGEAAQALPSALP